MAQMNTQVPKRGENEFFQPKVVNTNSLLNKLKRYEYELSQRESNPKLANFHHNNFLIEHDPLNSS